MIKFRIKKLELIINQLTKIMMLLIMKLIQTHVLLISHIINQRHQQVLPHHVYLPKIKIQKIFFQLLLMMGDFWRIKKIVFLMRI